MPSPEITPAHSYEPRAASGHVNLMVDTLIANMRPEDLRAIMRTLLATHSPALASAFTDIARARLVQINAQALPPSSTVFVTTSPSGLSKPAPSLEEVLKRARSLYGAGMGFASLSLLASIVRDTWGRRWEAEGEMIDALTMIDADITQALQSSREELEGGRIADLAAARAAAAELREALKGSDAEVTTWGGEFPFERGAASMDHWKF
ncbi:hypothetical protein GLOTRDRAFT_115901 [Gloeophyllum trabeum ATCC 11539]|uniref:Uncharacterized protein n=1 Tax=Gloeophyllum trabeum (strain ATCC 11539 / FP-39264 / Madison 617) TaxID=670483 RepID=S7RRH1_GLOTA|nr:uncharacterized protein GLOTRDRAFT_115901 [Gloeophyllum trabeum ATCC 11539]EPQ55539.1 hypothetical protein GLOTRDRAFT_115901 [Gloeophyllum trabeum ATCC 11539]